MTVDRNFPETSAETSLDQILTKARTHFEWQDRPLPEGTVERLYAAVRMGPTSANCSPARFVFVESPEAKERLLPCLSSGNREKTRTAPLTVIIAHDPQFHDHLPELFPHADAKSWFVSSPEFAAETALRNGSLQGAYLMLAARAMGLDVGAMSGFTPDAVREAFLAESGWQPNFIVNIGYGRPEALFDRSPRLDFATACRRV
ncbi:malonic semialdehyde reductase [Jiella mangrovi]|uniref:Putative NADH dehydrogenase/NAD(P)H nitroreductase J6595_12860 n=1 Tax=Jiella mangrovi TaxID=2821407 RepID=A0ABS4BI90_9HYPH|nr:malonic semialdehyde reductase [Jiella mangrovi]MBP0616473.1 malonic semialdehyde reductase [Jiella mangrovi]